MHLIYTYEYACLSICESYIYMVSFFTWWEDALEKHLFLKQISG